jgi:hypothetical protein
MERQPPVKELMNSVSLRGTLVLALACALAGFVSVSAAAGTVRGRQAAAVPVSSAAVAAVDPNLTDAARLLAGLAPSPAGRLATVAAKPEWQKWRQEFDREWTLATRDRFAQIADWRDRELKNVVGGCSTLMYPFSGPDILNAWLLFPDCERYILFGLEQPGSLPALDHLSAERLSRLLDETRHALNTLLARNYFITKNMLSDTAAEELRGTLPLMAVFLVRLNAQLISARDMEIAEDGQLRPRRPTSTEHPVARAIELVVARPGHPPQTVVYFRAQAEDKAIDGRPGVRPYLDRQGPFVTFLKSASYLLHGSEFTKVRDVLLKRSRVILQDDSGIPLRFLPAPAWTVTFYGKYSKPVKDFNYGYQADMEKAYASDPHIKPLPFSFGYHWSDGGASVLLAVKAGPASH